ncbi:hypothetical protein EDF31_102557 [Curtobacterium sp. PhB142]|nr:hypothetical protein EDF31_102557 [Curtobacterium sp. PhB142]TCM04803.1 hypothetical protein EDF26_10122 [Curtobacterium sp. PhB134]TCU42677.1 hypothetical protein EDF33_11312 [Curtobacterium sp. PhB146]
MRMPPRIPQLPSTVSVHGHWLQLELVPSQTARKEWRVTEQLGAHLVGQAPLLYECGEFSTETSTGTITDADWGVVLMRAFGRSWSPPR